MRIPNQILPAILATVVMLTGFHAFGGAPEFKHSKKAKLLVSQYIAAVARERTRLTREVGEIQEKYGIVFRDRRETLLGELARIQDEETKSGNLDAAVEVKEAIAELVSPPTDTLTPDEIRTKLVGTVWMQEPNTKPDYWFRFNDDGTVTASWHKQPSMWGVLPNGTVQMMYTNLRFVRSMRLDASFDSGAGLEKDAPSYRRVK